MNANKIIAYINSSVASVVEASHTPLFKEGEIADPFRDINEDAEYELRIGEFEFHTGSANDHRVTFEVDILVKARIIPATPYNIEYYLGQVVTTLSGNIPIRKYGQDVEDDESVIDCLKRNSIIRAINLGQVKEDVHIVFGQVNTTYSLTWSE